MGGMTWTKHLQLRCPSAGHRLGCSEVGNTATSSIEKQTTVQFDMFLAIQRGPRIALGTVLRWKYTPLQLPDSSYMPKVRLVGDGGPDGDERARWSIGRLPP